MSNGASDAVTIPVPHFREYEESLIGALLLDPETIVSVATVVRAQDFYIAQFGAAYQAALDLYGRGTPADVNLLAGAMIDAGDTRTPLEIKLSLSDCMLSCPSAAHALFYAERVAKLAQHRALIDAGGKIAGHAYNTADPTPWLTAQALLEAVYAPSGGSFVEAESLVMAAIDRLERRAPRGVPTGFAMLDDLLGGLQPTDLIIAAARPGAGKSAWAGAILRNACALGYKAGLFSLEMPASQVVLRLIASEAGVDLHDLRTGELTGEQWDAINNAAPFLASLPLRIDDTPGLTIAELSAKAKRAVHEHGIELIVVDYLQLLSGTARRTPDRVAEVSEISKELKLLARKLRVPVLALCQMSRNIEHRHSHEPVLSDLKESGSIEQDADVVLFLHREDMYDNDTPKRGLVEIRVAKHRNGALAWVPLLFEPAATHFQDLTYGER